MMDSEKTEPSAYADLFDTLQNLFEREDADEIYQTLSSIAELMRQVGDNRLQGAQYERTFDHGILSVRVKYGRVKHG